MCIRDSFEYFLRTEKKCRTNTVWGYMIGLKHVISIARNSGALDVYKRQLANNG